MFIPYTRDNNIVTRYTNGNNYYISDILGISHTT